MKMITKANLLEQARKAHFFARTPRSDSEFNRLVNMLAVSEINEPKNLRDEFAMAALTGICSNPEWRNCMGETFAHAAYELADEMLAERLVSTDKQDETNPE